MTQIAAIVDALLNGQVLSIMTGFQKFACSNIPREISRSVEQKFGVIVSKDRVDFISKYGQTGYYFRYRLNQTDQNKEGIEKMRKYLSEQQNGNEVADNKNKIPVIAHTRTLHKAKVSSNIIQQHLL